MFRYIWDTFFFNPVYNALIFFVDKVPGGDVGIAIILTVILIKVILLPLSIKAAKTQKIMREIEPQLRELKTKFKDDKQKQAEEMMKIYREAGLNPFSAIAVFFLQIPIVVALYFAVSGYGGVQLPEVKDFVLYSFISIPQEISMMFFSAINMAERSFWLALLAGLTMYYQMKLVMDAIPKREITDQSDFTAQLAKNMQTQMKYVMPVMIAVFAYIISAAIALYFLISNIVAILQEFYIRKHR